MNDILDSLKNERFAEERAAHVEKANKSSLIPVTCAEFYDTLKACWKAKNTHHGLAVATGLSWGATTLLRGNNQQLLELSDLWGSFYEGTDYLVCHAVCKQGKVLGVGQVQHAACMLHKDPHWCPVGHLAFNLVHRFHGDGSFAYPNFWSRSAWYDRKVLCQLRDEVTCPN